MAASKTSSLYEKIAPFLILLVVMLAFGIGALWQRVSMLEQGQTAGVPQVVPTQPEAPMQGKLPAERAEALPRVSADDHVRGSANAEIFLIEYSDYACGYCSRFHPTAQQVLEEFGGRVALVYRHFPFLSPDSTTAAVASECVAELGGNDAFWAFTDKMFENHPVNVSNSAAVATSLGINSTAFQSCLDSEKYSAKVQEQYTSGVAAGVKGTPGNFILNSKGEVWLLPGAVPFDMLKSTIEEALAS